MSFTTILYFLVVCGAIQGILILIALQRIKDRNHSANRVLFFLILSISVILISRLSYGQLFFWQPKLAMIPDIIVFVFGPLVFLYVKALLTTPFTFKREYYLHFLLALVHLIILSRSFFIPNDVYITMYRAGEFYLRNYIILGTALIHSIVYLFMSYRLLIQYQDEANKTFSFVQKVQYLKYILGLMAICLVLWLASYLAAVLTNRPSLDFHTYNFLWIGLSFVTYFLGYFAMTQPEIFKVSVEHKKYQTFQLSQEKIDSLREQLDTLIKSEKIYLQSNLTIKDLAIALDDNIHTISQLINRHYKMNFFDFINTHRIEEFISRASSPDYRHLSFLGLAFEVGFTNKTSFNRAFKKLKGVSPREYLKSVKRVSSKG